MAYGDLPFRDISCPVPDVNIYWIEIINVWAPLSTDIHYWLIFLSYS